MANMIYTHALFLHCLYRVIFIAYVTYYSILNVGTSIKTFLLKRGRISKMVFSCFVLYQRVAVFILLLLSARVTVLCRGGYFNIQVEMFSYVLSDQIKPSISMGYSKTEEYTE